MTTNHYRIFLQNRYSVVNSLEFIENIEDMFYLSSIHSDLFNELDF